MINRIKEENRPILSIVIVNFRGGKYIQLLLDSLNKTISDDVEYEVVVVNNRRIGYLYQGVKSLPRLISELGRRYILFLIRGLDIKRDMQLYTFKIPDGMNCLTVNTSINPVFWGEKMGVRGKTVSQSHSAGVSFGYSRISQSSKYVVLLDQDTVFLKKNWLQDFLNLFENDQELVLAGTAFENKIYERSFLRPYCLMFSRMFYDNFNDLFKPTSTGDTCSQLTYLCEDNGKKYHLFNNSLNYREVRSKSRWGDIAQDKNGEVFFVHRGHSGKKDKDGEEKWVDLMYRELGRL